MKPATTLKELLPPFEQLYNNIVCSGTELLKTGRSPLFDSDEFCDTFMNFVVTALNEKWERDFGEPLRWIWGEHSQCPKCKDYAVLSSTNYCPHCGQRLFPPEEA